MNKMECRNAFFYYLLRIVLFPFAFLSFPMIRRIGRILGTISFYFLKSYRKRTLSNLSLARGIVNSEEQLFKIAKESFQSLMITCLEYPKLSSGRGLFPNIYCENPEKAAEIYLQGKGIVFFCAHQANWEVLFLEGTSRMRGVAIGKPIKNRYLYHWIIKLREQFGGTIVEPKNALKQGLKALKQGVFLGIVGDQGTPSSGLYAPFLGRMAWTSTAPALLAYKTASPLFFAETKRTDTGYAITYHGPFWPDTTLPIDQEVSRLMQTVLSLLETSIRKCPGEWLWQHNRWKMQTPKKIMKRFRHDSLLVILPKNPSQAKLLLPLLSTVRALYPTEFLMVIAPEELEIDVCLFQEVTRYQKIDEPYSNLSYRDRIPQDFRPKLVFNWSGIAAFSSLFKKLSAFEVIELEDLQKKPCQGSLEDRLIQLLCRPSQNLLE